MALVARAVMMTAALAVLASFPGATSPMSASGDPLPSWNAGPRKAALVDFVTRVTTPGSPDFVREPERIATFDNDGTLWTEQPIYVEFAFALDRVKSLAPQHPEWRERLPFSAVLANDLPAVANAGKKGLGQMVMATHTGLTTEAFALAVSAWVRTARHPRFNRPYTDLVYQPMRELLAYLERHDFKIYVVSGGTAEFMRAWSEKVYGIPPERIIGTTFVTRFEGGAGVPMLVREPRIEFIDDGPDKPVEINKFIGRRPIAAFGNSDGDLPMLQWTTAGPGPRLALIVRHTDARREWAYDRESHVGRLDRALDVAAHKGWLVVDMKQDWNVVYSFER